MRLLVNSLFLLTLLATGATTAWSANGPRVNVEAMIGEATLIHETVDGQKDSVVVPTGQATETDPKTGKTRVAASTLPNAVNEVVHAIAAAAPDASNRLSTDEGCSDGVKPLRDVSHPSTDAEAAAAIEAQLAALSEGELMMVMAVLINNARHLCIDSDTVAATITRIGTVRPDVVANVVVVAVILDPTNTGKFTDAAKPPGAQAQVDTPLPQEELVDPPINNAIPPGGGEPPSPE